MALTMSSWTVHLIGLLLSVLTGTIIVCTLIALLASFLIGRAVDSLEEPQTPPEASETPQKASERCDSHDCGICEL